MASPVRTRLLSPHTAEISVCFSGENLGHRTHVLNTAECGHLSNMKINGSYTTELTTTPSPGRALNDCAGLCQWERIGWTSSENKTDVVRWSLLFTDLGDRESWSRHHHLSVFSVKRNRRQSNMQKQVSCPAISPLLGKGKCHWPCVAGQLWLSAMGWHTQCHLPQGKIKLLATTQRPRGKHRVNRSMTPPAHAARRTAGVSKQTCGQCQENNLFHMVCYTTITTTVLLRCTS